MDKSLGGCHFISDYLVSAEIKKAAPNGTATITYYSSFTASPSSLFE
ncbi:hypothetical protein [Ekhidna sp.]